MDEKKNCDNCRYFSVHYVKSRGGTFMNIQCGHCICVDMNRNLARKTVERRLKCDKWEPREIKIQERREEIERTLAYMENHLKEIAQCLRDDRDYLEGKQ